ncbi:MAG: amidohydrolase [Fimbriimonadaceae bacterium]|nr:amidohydrolase [Fimbriimonadaceae bacterium]QYK55813.1 MAG: amidohydrolase [Fimbriimonadaceae bacterium]
MPALRDRVSADHAFLSDLRHEFHAHPEVMYEEVWTSARVKRELEALGVEHVAGLAGGTGILAWLPATGERKATVALRADMDALPIHEETGLPYASQVPGKMHACGHDGHTTILIGAVRALAQEAERPNEVLFLFQPAEEGGAGAKRMVEDGVLAGRVLGSKPDVIYGLHGNPLIEQGTMTVRNGPMMAATDEFIVHLEGRGCHAAMPHLGTDPVVALAQVVTALQTVASRNVSPLESIVFSVTTLTGGAAHNVIPEAAIFSGTMRTLRPEERELGRRRFYEIVEGVAAAMGCSATISWRVGYPVTANDPWATDRFRRIARATFGETRIQEERHPTMGGEDFSFYGAECPACFFFVGTRRPEDESPALLHTPRFDFNDSVIPDCVETMCRLALEAV